MLSDLTLEQMIARIIALGLISALLGWSMAALGRLAGEKGPTYDGRLTVNPFTHLDLFGLVAAIFSRAGWIKPVALDAKETKGGLAGVALCIALSLLGLILAAFVVSRLRHLPVQFMDPSFSMPVTAAMDIFCECAIWSACLNLIPIPPLAAGTLLTGAASPRLRQSISRNQFWLSFAVGAVMVGTGGEWLRPIAAPLTQLILG